jgi:hypothetical protein
LTNSDVGSADFDICVRAMRRLVGRAVVSTSSSTPKNPADPDPAHASFA